MPLLMLLPIAASQHRSIVPLARWIAYATPGLIAVLSPLPGVLCGLGVASWIVLTRRKRAIRELLRFTALSLSVAAVVLVVACPVPPWVWMQNLAEAGRITPSTMEHLASPAFLELPLWNLLVFGAITLLALGMIHRGVAWVALGIGVVFAVVLRKTQMYTFVGFVPVIMIALVGRQAQLLGGSARLRLVSVALVSIVAAAQAGGLLRTGMLTMLFVREGVSYDEAHAEIARMEKALGGPGEAIGFVWHWRPSFVVFGRAGHGLVSVERLVLDGQSDEVLRAWEVQQRRTVLYILLPQMGQLLRPPPASRPRPLLA